MGPAVVVERRFVVLGRDLPLGLLKLALPRCLPLLRLGLGLLPELVVGDLSGRVAAVCRSCCSGRWRGRGAGQRGERRRGARASEHPGRRSRRRLRRFGLRRQLGGSLGVLLLGDALELGLLGGGVGALLGLMKRWRWR